MSDINERKMCRIEDPEELRPLLEKGGNLSCSICCAVSDDAKNLCSPVNPTEKNLFCDP
jgi:hypothetical protein